MFRLPSTGSHPKALVRFDLEGPCPRYMTRTDRERRLGAWGLNESISAAVCQVFPFSREATVLLPISVSTGLYRNRVAEETGTAVPATAAPAPGAALLGPWLGLLLATRVRCNVTSKDPSDLGLCLGGEISGATGWRLGRLERLRWPP